ncbi:MAG: EamA family transporter [Deltaproteobacteria bacterium]|nr:EamA family transporter [Deltaproteobacteria bacterium]
MSREAPPELSRPAAHALLHGVVLLWGCTAILGRVISIEAIPLVWYRLLMVVVVLAVVVPVRGLAIRIPARAALRYGVVGAGIGLHWLCFYGAIKQAGVSTAVLMLSTITFFTALVEPIVFRRRVSISEVVIGATVVAGVALLVRVELRADLLGIALGLGSAVFAAIFGVLNGLLAKREPPERLMFYELTAAALVVTLCFAFAPSQFVAPWALSGADLGWLAVLAVLCTVLPQIWVIYVLRTLSPFTVAVSVNLEPVYALILVALLFPGEEALSTRFYVGAAVLFAVVILNGVRRSRAASPPSPA